MKKRNIILSLALLIIVSTFAIVANGLQTKAVVNEDCCNTPTWPNYKSNLNFEVNSNFIFQVGPRFNTTVSKSQINAAIKLTDLIPPEASMGLDSFKLTKVALVSESPEINALSKEIELNSEQRKLLDGLSYSDNFYIQANCIRHNNVLPENEDYRLVYYISYVPETPAKYKNGQEELLNYLKAESYAEVNEVDWSILKPGRISFEISEDGLLENPEVETSSNYPELDSKMLAIIENLKHQWIAAKDKEGKNVRQKLYFFYGKQGC